MEISAQGLDLIKESEGCHLSAYSCPGGVLTIGYGHTGSDVRHGMTITQTQAEELLRRDAKIASTCLNGLGLMLRQCQFDALCSFVFNVGCGAFIRSTLLKKIRVNPNDESIRSEFERWTRSGGKTLPGLVARRALEANLYFKADE